MMALQLEDITFSNLYLWHGELDSQIPIAGVRTLCQRLTTCKTTYFENEGHISLIVNHGKEIVDTLAML